ncbi:MarR family winged helix-turn-helix transcriptional regulator [Kutzneria sp. CA-103260]|uniref:MarR family winged helix-turn-helix transcriptional regulator n=1 Tax=Kutzneria sp. CA-103260 TaxID=2802641 RepID=UPI0020113851|nr:MarR family transcriptional regulator [Kutzneria sp. CA-103260]
MSMSDSQAAAQWELGKLVHELDMQNSARMRERVAKLGLTTAQASALRELTGPMTMSELAGRMACEPSNATVVIDKLESQRLIERRAHPSDRRAKQLTLTPEGAEQREQLLAVLSEEPLVTGLAQRELDALRDLLERAISRD